MQEQPSGVDNRTDAPATRDWSAILRERLSGSQPRHDRSSWVVPGLTAADSQSYQRLFPPNPVPAAVLVPLVERPELTVLLTERSAHLRDHAGQISFPGGRIESEDETPRAAALRESAEEIGLDQGFVSVIGYLPDHILFTGFRVTPMVAFVRPGFALSLDKHEVVDTFEVPLAYIFDPKNHRHRRRRAGFSTEEFEFAEIPFGERNIWGATAGMLMTLYRLCIGTLSP